VEERKKESSGIIRVLMDEGDCVIVTYIQSFLS